nr:immunoglobulin heavy chain junction region [Macaca mulatta]
CARGGGNLDVW